MYASDFSAELMKRAKAFVLHQVLHLNVDKSYLDNQMINWGTNEIRHHKYPHLIEIKILKLESINFSKSKNHCYKTLKS